MEQFQAGDLVKRQPDGQEMLILGPVEENETAWLHKEAASFFCVWEQQHFLHEEVIPAEQLIIVRRERRRIPRGGKLQFPSVRR
jgi:hypothetical protein